jgi:hypothetical protein
VRSDLRVVALAFAADSSTLQSPVDVKERKAATPKKKAAAPKPAKPAVATAASKKRFVSDDEDEDASYEDNAPKVKPKKKPTAAPKPAAPVKPTAAAPKPAAAPKKQADLLSMLKPANKTGPAQAAAKWEPPVQVVADEELPLLERLKAKAASKKRIDSDDEDNAPEVKPKKKPTAAPKPAAAPAKPTAAAPKPAAPVKPTAAAPPRATASKSKKHVVSDDEDYSDDEDDADDEDDGDSDAEVSSHAHGSPSCRVPIPML